MSRLKWQAVVAGVGGQGVLFVTRVLAQAAQKRTGKVLISEVHGMAQRGGSVVSHLKAGEFASPLVALGQADALISLDAGEAIRNLAFLKPGGGLVVNAPGPEFLSAEGQDALAKHKVTPITIDATGLAMEAGAMKGANVVLLAAAAQSGALPFARREIEAVLTDITPPARMKANEKLFALGCGA